VPESETPLDTSEKVEELFPLWKNLLEKIAKMNGGFHQIWKRKIGSKVTFVLKLDKT
jgi:hypothetical protein